VWTIPPLVIEIEENTEESHSEHGEDHEGGHVTEHSQTEVNLIITALLLGSWGIIFTCRYLDMKKEAAAKKKAQQTMQTAAPKFKL